MPYPQRRMVDFMNKGSAVKLSHISAIILLIQLLFVPQLHAQTGRVRGSVVEIGTGDPIIGANVVIKGTSRGAATDLEGFYVILAVQPGTYTMKASAVGYFEQEFEDVEVKVDQTSYVSFELESSAVQQEIVVPPNRKPPQFSYYNWEEETRRLKEYYRDPWQWFQRRVQRGRSGYTEDCTGHPDVLKATPGFNIDQEGKIHIQGGRGRDFEPWFDSVPMDTIPPRTDSFR